MKLSVIIVNYNAFYFLTHCLASVRVAAAYAHEKLGLATEVWIIDNASADDNIEKLRETFPEYNFLENSVNKGFGAANNQALQYCTGNWVLFLNPDTLLTEDIFVKAIEALQADPKRGALGVRMIDGSGHFLPESKRGYPGIWASFTKMSGLYRIFSESSFWNAYYAADTPEKQDGEVDVLSGAFMMVRKNILDKIGAFDEDFFMYGEDIDLSYRIIKAGYKNYYLGTQTILHYKGESTVKDRAYIERFYGAMELFVKKHEPNRQAYLNKILKILVKYKSAGIAKKTAATQQFIDGINIPVKLAGNIAGVKLPDKILQKQAEEEVLLQVYVIQCPQDYSTFIHSLQQAGRLPSAAYIFPYNFIIHSENKEVPGKIFLL